MLSLGVSFYKWALFKFWVLFIPERLPYKEISKPVWTSNGNFQNIFESLIVLYDKILSVLKILFFCKDYTTAIKKKVSSLKHSVFRALVNLVKKPTRRVSGGDAAVKFVETCLIEAWRQFRAFPSVEKEKGGHRSKKTKRWINYRHICTW